MNLQHARINDLVVSMVTQKVQAKTSGEKTVEISCNKGQVMGIKSITHPGPTRVVTAFYAEISEGRYDTVEVTFTDLEGKIDWLRSSATSD